MPKKPETTSKRVASKAAQLLNRIDAAIPEIKRVEHDIMMLNSRVNFLLPMVRGILMDAESVAASALTQSADKRRK